MAGSTTRLWLRFGVAVLLGAALGACTRLDQGMRRADALDRVVEPERGGSPKAPPAEAALGAELAPMPAEGRDELPPLAARPESGTGLPPGWYVPDPPTAPEVSAAQPLPLDPAARSAALLRQNPWIARFWSELTPVEQSRVTRALARRGAAGPVPAAWDPMGLADRLELLFGPIRAAS